MNSNAIIGDAADRAVSYNLIIGILVGREMVMAAHYSNVACSALTCSSLLKAEGEVFVVRATAFFTTDTWRATDQASKLGWLDV